MTRSFVIAILALSGLVACGSSETTEPTPGTEPTGTTTGSAPTGATTAPTTGTTAPTTGAGAAAPTGGAGGTISITTGFTDPTMAEGTSGGAVDASTLNSECRGYVSSSPDHILEVGAAFPRLRVMALGTEADSDVTLVVHKPDGSYLCNDDSDGFHPMVEGEFAAGRYEVFVGSYEQGRRQTYRLGISAQENATPSTTLAPAGAAPAAQ
jgi:hypothetical protein